MRPIEPADSGLLLCLLRSVWSDLVDLNVPDSYLRALRWDAWPRVAVPDMFNPIFRWRASSHFASGCFSRASALCFVSMAQFIGMIM